MFEKTQFCYLVMQTLEEHPDWNHDVFEAMTQGIMNRLSREINQRANCETALVMCYDIAKDKLPEKYQDKVKTAIKTSFSYSGTKYAEEL